MFYCKKKLHLVDYSKYRQCPVCKKDAKRLWEKANPDKVKACKQREYLKNREKRIVTNTNGYKARYADPIKRAKILQTTSNYKKRFPVKNAALASKRRAAQLQRTPKWLTSVHLSQIELFYEAANKLTKEFGIPMEVDHIIPLQGKIVSGLHVPWNLQVITQAENCSKNNSFGGY